MKFEKIKVGASVFSGFAFKSAELNEENGIPVIKIGNLQNKSVDYSSTQFFPSEKVTPKIQKFLLEDNDILIAMTGQGSVGRVCKLRKQKKDALLLNQRVGKFVCNPSILDSNYLFYVLSSEEYQSVLFNAGYGSGQPNLSPDTILNISIPFPSIEKQREIADILNSLDEKIAINQQINDNLLMQMRTVYQSLCATDNEREKSDKMWKLASIDEICSLVSRGIAPKYSDDTNEYVINQKCIRNSMIDTSLARQHTPKKKNEKWIQYGDLLVNSTGDGTLGRTAQVWFHTENMTVDSHVTIMRPCRSELMYYLGMWGISNEKLIESLHTGSTGQTELPRERLKALQLPLPDTDVLVRFNATIKPMTEMIMKNQQENKQLEQMRDRLLPKLMSGEIII